MKTKLTLTLTLLAFIASAQTLTITQKSQAVTLSINDTNHLYSIQHTTNLSAGFTADGTSNIGGPNLSVTFKETTAREYFRAVQLDGFLIYATPTPGAGGGAGACTGSYIGSATYVGPDEQPFWIMETNAPSYTASDGTGRTDTHIYAISISGDYACGKTPLAIPYQDDPDGQFPFFFMVYFPSNLPSGPYPIRLQGFTQ